MDTTSLIAKAAELLTSEAALGRAAGFSQNAIWAAKRNGRVSAEMAAGIHRATKGRVPKWELRPDLWDAPSRSRSKAADAAVRAGA